MHYATVFRQQDFSGMEPVLRGNTVSIGALCTVFYFLRPGPQGHIVEATTFPSPQSPLRKAVESFNDVFCLWHMKLAYVLQL